MNLRRQPGLLMSCDNDLGIEAEKVLLKALTHSSACSVEALIDGRFGLPTEDLALLAGPEVLSCGWDDSVNAWTWPRGLPQDDSNALLLLSSGGLKVGCAQGMRSGVDGLEDCQARACLVSPSPTTPFMTSSWLGSACADRCLGSACR